MNRFIGEIADIVDGRHLTVFNCSSQIAHLKLKQSERSFEFVSHHADNIFLDGFETDFLGDVAQNPSGSLAGKSRHVGNGKRQEFQHAIAADARTDAGFGFVLQIICDAVSRYALPVGGHDVGEHQHQYAVPFVQKFAGVFVCITNETGFADDHHPVGHGFKDGLQGCLFLTEVFDKFGIGRDNGQRISQTLQRIPLVCGEKGFLRKKQTAVNGAAQPNINGIVRCWSRDFGFENQRRKFQQNSEALNAVEDDRCFWHEMTGGGQRCEQSLQCF